MGRVLVAVLLVLSLVFQLPVAEASDWSRVVKMLYPSTAPIMCELHKQNTCTAFSINRDAGLYLTAKHCVQPIRVGEEEFEQVAFDGKSIQIVWQSDAEVDLAIIRSDVKRPALRYRTKALEVGNEVGAMGYGGGLSLPMFRTAIVSLFIRSETNVEWAVFDNTLVPGMSGGPIVDREGRVVGVNDKTNTYSGFSLSIRQIIAATQFWEAE